MSASTHHDDYQLLLALLKETRRNSAITQVQLAGRLQNTQTFVSKVERGERRLDAVELFEYLEALDVAPDQWIRSYLTARDLRLCTQKRRKKIAAR